ncbi:MAG: hypothetical protein Fur0041_02370 [Bacteroidia bacterium]
MVIKTYITFLLALLLFACGNQKKERMRQAQDSANSADSALIASMNVGPARSKDTLKMLGMPPVFDGDIVMQISDGEHGTAISKATGSKYNHCGIIFKRQRDNILMVLEAYDSVKVMQLTDWVNRGKDKHVAVLRLKDANQNLNARRTEKLNRFARSYKNKPYDPYFSWNDDAMYCSELVWKIYKGALDIELCKLRELGSFDLSSPEVKKQLDIKYGKNIPKKENVVSPADIYNSPLLEKIYEY